MLLIAWNPGLTSCLMHNSRVADEVPSPLPYPRPETGAATPANAAVRQWLHCSN